MSAPQGGGASVGRPWHWRLLGGHQQHGGDPQCGASVGVGDIGAPRQHGSSGHDGASGGPRQNGASGGAPQCSSGHVGAVGGPPRSGSSVRFRGGPPGGRQGLGIIGHPWDPYVGPGSSIADPHLLRNVPNPYEVAALEQQVREVRLLLGPIEPAQPPPEGHNHKEEPQEQPWERDRKLGPIQPVQPPPEGHKHKEDPQERRWKRDRNCDDEEPKVDHPWRRRRLNQGAQKEGH